QVDKALDADVTAPPFREEFPVERVEALELEDVVGEQEPASHDSPDGRRHPFRSQEIRQRAEVEGELACARLAGPGERLDDEKLGQAIRGARATAHRAQRPPAAPSGLQRGREMEKAAEPPLRIL